MHAKAIAAAQAGAAGLWGTPSGGSVWVTEAELWFNRNFLDIYGFPYALVFCDSDTVTAVR